MNIQKNHLNLQNIAFKGHKKTIDKTGYDVHKFYYVYDPKKYDCELELYNINKDKKGNMSISGDKIAYPMKDGSVTIDMDEVSEITSDIGFAYRFKLTDKTSKNKEVSYAFDNGTVIGIFDNIKNSDNKFNVILNNRATINKNGPMQLIMPDIYYPGVEGINGNAVLNQSLRGIALSSVRTHANKLGGNFMGIIKRLNELEKEGVKRIVGTPYTKDTISSHLYWTENGYQIAPTLGTEKDFKKLQVELFKHGMNWIADAALVNEGFGGIHMSELLRKGNDSISKDMFRADSRISLGILPDKCDYTRMKIINAPFLIDKDGKYHAKNPSYTSLKPTYVQFYDSRLASEKQINSESPIDTTTYDNKNTDNIYDITKHDDAVYPFPLEVSPEQLKRNAKIISEQKGKIDLADIDTIKQLNEYTNFNVVNKSAAGGLEVWDGNVDIAKLNFYRCDKDDSRFIDLPDYQREQAIQDFNRGTLAVREYALNAGKYWTQLTSDTLLQYVSEMLGKVDDDPQTILNEIKDLENKNILPKDPENKIDEEVIKNVLDDNYNLHRLDDADMRADINPEDFGNDYNVNDYILRKSMEVPLETLPIATNLLGIITSPYIAKKPNIENELGVSRYDLYKAGNPNLPQKYKEVYQQAEEFYTEQVVPFIDEIIQNIPDISDDKMVSEYGKYVISEIVPDLTKYLFVKALDPNADIRISKDGKFDFSNVDESKITIQSLGIPFNGMSMEEEAQIVINSLRNGVSKINESDKEELIKSVKTRFKNRSLEGFKLAEMIIDRTESGLGWRIDAAKDIASIDSVRSDADSMTKAWKNVTDFWGKYNQAVLDINRHAYTTAEITDLADLFRNEDKGTYTSDADAERKFIEETGITAVANYNYFFSLLPSLFSKNSFETGDSNWEVNEGKNFEIREKLDTGWSGTNPGFLFQSPDDGVVNSYTFIGNHDKPRVLHCLGLDMGLFNSDFTNEEHKKAAASCLDMNEEEIDFDRLSNKAVAMATRLNSAFEETVKDSKELSEIKKAIKDLTLGEFKGRKFDAEAFGTRPFEVAIKSVLDEVEYNKGKISNRDNVEAETIKSILEPAFRKFYAMYKLLMVLPGSPTDFAGDRVGSTGYESKAKNYHQQNRNVINWEWLEDDNYKFIKEFYNNMNQIANIRGKDELSALNDGSTVTLPILQEDEKSFNEKVQAFLRYNDKGSIVLVITDNHNSNTPIEKEMNTSSLVLSPVQNGSIANRIILSADQFNAKQGLKHGLTEGTILKNERSDDSYVYKIEKMKIQDKDTKQEKEYYYLKKEDQNGNEVPLEITPEDCNTLILYKPLSAK